LLRVFKLRLKLINDGLFRLNVGLERRLLDAVEQPSFLNFHPFVKEALFKKARDPSNKVDAADSLNAAQELARFDQGFLFCADNANRRWSERRGLRRCLGGKAEKRQNQEATPKPKNTVTPKTQSLCL
jgi:hypothetical protein